MIFGGTISGLQYFLVFFTRLLGDLCGDYAMPSRTSRTACSRVKKIVLLLLLLLVADSLPSRWFERVAQRAQSVISSFVDSCMVLVADSLV